jgi:hypothetical protein
MAARCLPDHPAGQPACTVKFVEAANRVYVPSFENVALVSDAPP